MLGSALTYGLSGLFLFFLAILFSQIFFHAGSRQSVSMAWAVVVTPIFVALVLISPMIYGLFQHTLR